MSHLLILFFFLLCYLSPFLSDFQCEITKASGEREAQNKISKRQTPQKDAYYPHFAHIEIGRQAVYLLLDMLIIATSQPDAHFAGIALIPGIVRNGA